MKITVLCEDTSCGNLKCEHGLSVYIQSENANILFDTGQSDLFFENAEKLGVDLRNVDFAVISHGHYDHGGGLKTFLKVNNTAPVFISPYAFGEHYNGEKYIGLDKSLQTDKRLVFVRSETRICKGVKIFSAEGLKPTGSFGLCVKKDKKILPDTFEHEIYLEITQGGKKALFSACSHKGIVNIMRRFKPDVFVGGMHLIKTDDEGEVEKTASVLAEYNTDYYTCHCTGEKQYEYLKKNLNSLKYLRTGDKIVI